MARIRTIKPEFWTDSTIVNLPFAARLLFIGLWNFADDEGYLLYDIDQIQMQVFPGDDVDVVSLLDALWAAELIDIRQDDEGSEYIYVRNFTNHQKISHPAESRIAPKATRRKTPIPVAARRAMAIKYGCKPGGTVECECYYCGAPGKIYWPTTSKGKPSFWVTSDLEFDHFVAEADGGEPTTENLVMACRLCNRGKCDREALSFMLKKAGIPESFTERSGSTPECSVTGSSTPDERSTGKEGRKDLGNDLGKEGRIETAIAVCPETDEPSAGPEPAELPSALLEFPCDGKPSTFAFTDEHAERYAKLYPKLVILDEAREALAWVLSNPKNRKTHDGMPRFLNNWFKKSSDRIRAAPSDRRVHDPEIFKLGGGRRA